MWEDFVEAYFHILSDPAHLAVELTLMVIIDLLILGLLWPMIKRAIFKEHLTIDAEHDVEHPGEEPLTWFFQ